MADVVVVPCDAAWPAAWDAWEARWGGVWQQAARDYRQHVLSAILARDPPPSVDCAMTPGGLSALCHVLLHHTPGSSCSCTQVLLAAEADPHQHDELPLKLAVGAECLDCLRQLLEAGADARHHGSALLQRAVVAASPSSRELAECLLRARAQLQAADAALVLGFGASRGSLWSVRLALFAGAAADDYPLGSPVALAPPLANEPRQTLLLLVLNGADPGAWLAAHHEDRVDQETRALLDHARGRHLTHQRACRATLASLVGACTGLFAPLVDTVLGFIVSRTDAAWRLASFLDLP